MVPSACPWAHAARPGLCLLVNGHLEVRSFGQLKVRTRGRSALLERRTSSPAASLPHPERLAGGHDAVHNSVQDELQKLEGDYSNADKPFETYVVEEGRLITRQNPGSARAVAEAVVNRLQGAAA